MPATPGGFAFERLMAVRGETVSEEEIAKHAEATGETFKDLVAHFLDLLVLHELGHELTFLYGIDTRSRWLDEFVPTYFAYAFLSERRPEGKRVFHLLGRAPQVRPKNTTLEDFEKLYYRVDDYGWYQLTFQQRIQEIYPQHGLKFVTDVRRAFPRRPRAERLPPSEVLERLEQFAPGFVAWAERLNE